MTDRLELKAAITVDAAGTITGVAWPFGTPDRVGDVIEKGAFAGATLPLPMLWAHDQAQVIGVWDELEETAEGLTVKGRLLVEDVARAREVRALIIEMAATGLSIGFHTKAATPRTRGRSITALDLLEVSIVAVPCHPAARITSAKSADDDAATFPNGDHMEPETTQAATPSNTPASDAPGIDTKTFDQIKARLDAIEAKAARPFGVAITSPAQTGERKAFENFIRRGVERMEADEIKALTVASNTNGGFLAPEEFGAELFKLLNEYSPIRSYAKVIQISAPQITYPRRVSGTGATWVSEVAARVASGMTFEQVTLTPHELATFTDISNALLEDNAYNLEGELLSDFAESFAKTEGLAFVNGTGAGQPFGIMAAAGIAELKTGVAANFPATNPADVLIKMYHSIATSYAQSGVWMMNRNTLGVVRQWKDGNGRYLVLDPISSGAPSTLLGRPIVEMPDMDDIGAGNQPILFGDMSGYRIVDRIGLSTLRDPFSIAVNGQVRIHSRKRVGADVTHPDRFIKLRVAV